MAFRKPIKQPTQNPDKQSESGIALFMVLASITMLTVMVTEFTYTTQVNYRLAYDGLDQIKAHYLAKSGFKLSLLRLKAYSSIKTMLASMGSGATAAVPKALLEKIWNFPFIYPIPSSLPGLSLMEKDAFAEFEKASSLQGKYTAIISSESSRYNLNLIVAGFQPKPTATDDSKKTGTGSTPPVDPSGQAKNPDGTPVTSTVFNPEAARTNLFNYFTTILNQKFLVDPDFEEEYRSFRLDDLVDAIAAWADRSYEQRNLTGRELIPPKRAPFYSLNELRMLQPMEDTLFDLFSPTLTVSTTPGINVNQIEKPTLRALFPLATDLEIEEFFKYRDSTEEDHLFKTPQAFFDYILKAFSFFRNDAQELTRFQKQLSDRGVSIITDETAFKIVVQAQVNQATRMVEAWVTLSASKTATPATAANPSDPTGLPNLQNQVAAPVGPPSLSQLIDTRTGLRVVFMRIL